MDRLPECGKQVLQAAAAVGLSFAEPLLRRVAGVVSTEVGRCRARWLALAVALAWVSSLPGEFVRLDHLEIERGAVRVIDAQDWSQLWTRPLDAYLWRSTGRLRDLRPTLPAGDPQRSQLESNGLVGAV